MVVVVARNWCVHKCGHCTNTHTPKISIGHISVQLHAKTNSIWENATLDSRSMQSNENSSFKPETSKEKKRPNRKQYKCETKTAKHQ